MSEEIIKPYQLNGCSIINDDDSKLTSEQIRALLKKFFGAKRIQFDRSQCIIDKKIALLPKNVTWLGYDKGHNDYRPSKKRIQLSPDYPSYVSNNYEKGIVTYYLGIYCYEREKDFLYVLFDTKLFAEKKSNNSAAHLSVYDLVSARNRGYFFKMDKSGNKIYILNQENFIDFITDPDNSVKETAEQEFRLLQYLKEFWSDIPKQLKGEECYREMFDAAYAKTFESEWVGYYHEYLFEKKLIENPTDLVKVYGDKKRGGIDLDLKVNIGDKFFADLKSDNEVYDIQGNKKDTIDDILDEDGHVWYIVAAFGDVVMDKIMDYAVMNEYNKLKGIYNEGKTKSNQKQITMDYKDKMKYSVELTNFYVLDINKGNQDYLLEYKQGVNSNGKHRGSKYKISKKTLDEFKIFEYKK